MANADGTSSGNGSMMPTQRLARADRN
jgi:hypothetical protein